MSKIYMIKFINRKRYNNVKMIRYPIWNKKYEVELVNLNNEEKELLENIAKFCVKIAELYKKSEIIKVNARRYVIDDIDDMKIINIQVIDNIKFEVIESEIILSKRKIIEIKSDFDLKETYLKIKKFYYDLLKK